MNFSRRDHLGDEMRDIYKKIYTGGDVMVGTHISRLVDIFYILSKAGMLTNITRRKLKAFLIKAINLNGLCVESRNTFDVKAIDLFTKEKDRFNLKDLIILILEELYNDPFVKNRVYSREKFNEIIELFNDCTEKSSCIEEEDWVDFYFCNDKVFFTKIDGEDIYLYLKQESRFIHIGLETVDNNDYKKDYGKIAEEELSDGRIFHQGDEPIVFIQTDKGYIKKIKVGFDRRCVHSKIKGKIIDQLKDESLLVMEDHRLIRLMPNGKVIVVVDNISGGFTCISTDGEDVFWKSNNKKKHNNIVKSLKVDRLSNEMLWKGLLFALYNFESMKFSYKLGDRIRFATLFERIPDPFNMELIVKRISEIERYCYDKDITKTECYVETMGSIMKIEDEQLNEVETHMMLEYILDSISIDPYKLISIDNRLINYIEYLTEGIYDFIEGTDDYNNGNFPIDYIEIEDTDEASINRIKYEIARMNKELEYMRGVKSPSDLERKGKIEIIEHNRAEIEKKDKTPHES